MKRNRSIVAVLAMTALGVAGCSRSTVAKDPGNGKNPDSAFCKQFLSFRTSTLGMNGLLFTDPVQAAQQATSASVMLVAMKPTVADNQSIQADLQTVANGFVAVAAQLKTVPPNDRVAYLNAVNKGIATVGTTATSSAESALDSYTTDQCGLTTSLNLAPTTTSPGSSSGTTLAPTGPVLPGPTTP